MFIYSPRGKGKSVFVGKGIKDQFKPIHIIYKIKLFPNLPSSKNFYVYNATFENCKVQDYHYFVILFVVYEAIIFKRVS